MSWFLSELTTVMTTDLPGLALSFFVLSITMVLAELWRYLYRPKVEWTRKLVHFCSGIMVACFPWLLKSVFSVVLVAVVMFVVMAVTKKFGLLQSVHSVSRKSYGDVFYLMAVVTLFLICHEQPHYYFASILTLAIADAMAAIIGSTYHRITFSVQANQKSLEGSAIFFLATFLTIEIPLLLLSDLPKEMAILIAAQVAIVVTLIEAIAINGFDNFAIPVAVYFLLFKLDDKSVAFLGMQIIAQLTLMIAGIIFCIRFKYFSVSAHILCHLVLLAAFCLCGPVWLIPPIAAVIIFGRWRRRSDKKNPERVVENYQLLSTAYVCFVPIMIIFVNNFLITFFHMHGRMIEEELFFSLYAGAVSASVSLSLVTLRKKFRKDAAINKFSQARLLLCTSVFCFFIIVPVSLIANGSYASISHWVIACGFAFLAPIVHFICWYRKQEHHLSYLAWQAASLGVCAIISSAMLVSLNF